MACTVVVGGFFGSEGKGKIVAYLALRDKPSIVVRGGVGPNAGHTIVYSGREYKLRQIPSGFTSKDSRLLIGAGVLVDPGVFFREMAVTETQGRIGVDHQCAVVETGHIERERENAHLMQVVKSSGTGVGPCMEDRVKRVAKLARDSFELAPYLTDVAEEIHAALDAGRSVLVEGTQGTFLSLYHGTYPHCTVKDVTASSICGDVGIGPTKVDDVIAVFKSTVTRSSLAGPLPGELSEQDAQEKGWQETTTVTRKPRRIAPFNLEMAKRAVRLNGATQIAVTKLDGLYPSCSRLRSYEKLPQDARQFLDNLEAEVRVPVTLIGTGPDTLEMIDRTPRR